MWQLRILNILIDVSIAVIAYYRYPEYINEKFTRYLSDPIQLPQRQQRLSLTQ